MEQEERQGASYESFGDSLAPPPLHSTGDSVLGASSSFLSMVQSYWSSSAPPTSVPALQSPAKKSPRGKVREGTDQGLGGQTRHPMYSLDTPSANSNHVAASLPSATAIKPLPPASKGAFSGSNVAAVLDDSSKIVYDSIAQNNAPSHLLKPMISKDFWMRDEYAKECYDCRALFTTFRRKHHCRICGQIFCFKCASSVIPGDRFGYQGDLRVCNFCMKILVKDRPEGPTPSVGVLPPPTTSMYASPAPILALGPRRSLEYGPSRRPPVPSPSQSPSETGEWLSKAHSSLPRRLKQMYTSSFGDITEAAKFDDDIRTSSADVSVDSISVSDLADITSHEQYQSKKSDGEESQFVDDEWAASPFRTPPTGIVTSIDFSKALDPSIRSALPSKVFSQDTSYSGKKYGSLKRKSFSNTLTRTLPGSKTRSLGRNPSTASYSNQPRQDPVTSPGFPEAKSGKHQRSMSIPGHIEFNATSISHMKQMLHQILKKNDIPQLELWEPVIFKLLLKVCDSVNPDVRSGDDHDVRHYVKIKRIPGGVPSDSHYVRGVVFTKNVAHKKMIYPKSNPRILLLTFALEYQRVENEFISLGPLLAQEKEHLRNLVARVAAVKPDIVLVQKTVSRLALEFLLEAGIAVAYNIKPSVIEAMSRCTSADIISSIDKLALSPRLGSCENFILRTYHHNDIPGIRKTYMYYEGCAKNLGCTIVLRGHDMLILSKLKQIMDFMVFIAYNLKLETYLLRDQFCQSPDEVPPSVQDLESLPSVMKEDSSDIPIETQLQDMIKAYSFTKLSASPQVSFHAPYLIQRKLDKEKSGQVGLGRRKSMDLAKSDTILPPENPKPDFTMLPQSDEDGEIIVSAIDANRAFLTTGSKDRADVDYLLDKSRRFLDPYVHQNIAILYSSVCKSMTEPCQPPELQLIEYYRDSDLTLGQYIEDACFNSSMSCSVKGCEKPILLHTRIYTHGNGKMLVTMEEQPCPLEGMEDVILMRSTCHVCGESTPIVPIAPETWKYSFGKYLELTFYQTALSCRADICPHAVTRDHTRFFHWKNLEIEIEHSEIVLFEVLVPPMLLDMKPEVFVKIRQADEDIIRLQITAYFDSVLDRIKHFSLDIVPATRLMQAKEMTAEMTKRCGSEKKFFLQLLQQTCVSAHQTDFIALNTVTKALLDKVASWDAEFNSFARNILQQESRDIRRMTAVQLKKMFTDRDAPEVKPIVALPSELARLELEAEQDATESVDSFLPVLGGSPMLSEVHLHGSPLDIPSYSRNRRHSVMLLRDTMHLENHIHVPRFGTSPTLETPVATISRLEASVLEIQETAPDESLKHPDTPTVTASESQLDIAGEDHGPISLPLLFTEAPVHLLDGGSPPKKNNVKLEDDEEPKEWNTISGVSVEQEPQDETSPAKEEPQLVPGERTSLMKTITNLWTGNPANFLPLEYPTNATEHFFPDSLIVVREDEPSSIIAFTLGSKHYKDKLLAKQSGVEISEKPSPVLDENTRFSIEMDDQFGDIEETLTRVTGTHIRYQFWDKSTKLQCKIYFAEQFSALRKNCGVEDVLVKALSRCFKWDATGGKSGSVFMKSRDDRFVIKQLSRLEMDALYKFAPAYFEYMSQAFFHELPTVLAKIFGFYRIGFKNSLTGKQVKMDVVVTENLFRGRKISKIFDLKGSVRNRHVKSTGNNAEVLLDENLVQFINEHPLFVREHCKKLLRASVWNDTLFLSKLNVMDYSLLVGIDEDNQELVVGIVDFIRTFTWDKKLESWVKETGFLGGGGKEPTIVSPRQYKVRFREAMDRYFLMVPDKFTSIT